MGIGSLPEETDLLARLNALKRTNVSFNSPGNPSGPTVGSGSDETAEDLVARFQKIHGRPSDIQQDQERELSHDTRPERPHPPTLEELLADLGPEDQYQLDHTELDEAAALLEEAKKAMPAESEHLHQEDRLLDTGHSEVIEEGATPCTAETVKSLAELDEDAEAQAALQRILDNAENESTEEETAPEIQPAEDKGVKPKTPAPDTFSALQFPSTPAAAFDSLDLPLVPTTAPIARKTKAKATAKPPSDQDIESWCVICCADASVQCFGCDKDLYCWGCWREGHMGEDAGLEEKHHVWERYKKPKVGTA